MTDPAAADEIGSMWAHLDDSPEWAEHWHRIARQSLHACNGDPLNAALMTAASVGWVLAQSGASYVEFSAAASWTCARLGQYLDTPVMGEN